MGKPKTRINNYVTVLGEVHTYETEIKPQNQQKRKPRCPNCGTVLNFITNRLWKNKIDRLINIGFICKFCDHVYVDHHFKCFKIRYYNKNGLGEVKK